MSVLPMGSVPWLPGESAFLLHLLLLLIIFRSLKPKISERNKESIFYDTYRNVKKCDHYLLKYDEDLIVLS